MTLVLDNAQPHLSNVKKTTIISDDEFVERWAKVNVKAGERPFYAIKGVIRYSKNLWNNHYRVSYYNPETNTLTRSSFVSLIGEGDHREVKVAVEPRSDNRWVGS